VRPPPLLATSSTAVTSVRSISALLATGYWLTGDWLLLAPSSHQCVILY